MLREIRKKRKDSAALANFKAKAKRHLLKKQKEEGGGTEEINIKNVNEMANGWREERELELKLWMEINICIVI